MGNINAALMQKIFDVVKREWIRIYIITARRMFSGLVSKYRNGIGFVSPRNYIAILHSPTTFYLIVSEIGVIH